jgi:hypothetical protein
VEEILYRSSYGWVISAFVVVVVVLIGLVVIAEGERDRSTKGVVTVSDYEATISKGETLVLTSTSGKTTNYWHVTFDGKRTVTVKQDTSFMPSEYSGSVCGIGCSQELEMGWLRHITIIERVDHRVSVQWPWGWGYRRYQ